MTRTWILALIAAGLVSVGVFVFLIPHPMVSPGKLTQAHADLTADCFACHKPFRGADPERCIGCHAIKDIGLRTTKGVALTATPLKLAFHQHLSTSDCTTCHTVHQGALFGLGSRPEFSHAALAPSIKTQCATCHTAPTTALHRDVGTNCGQCHAPSGWKPATFDHARFFPLTGDHAAPCATCHLDGSFARNTCYGCHEHQPDKIKAKHQREGIGNIENCVRCHRSGRGEDNEHKSSGRRERD